MIYPVLQIRKNFWIQSPNCPVRSLLDYIRQRGQLRDAQIEAIETYLFLKLAGDNKPLPELFAAGFFFEKPQNLEKIAMTDRAREVLSDNPAAWSLYQFARMPQNGDVLLPKLEKAIRENPDSISFQKIIGEIFYNVTYPDYLFSLPMGAGKTFLIASLIYLDLYFARQAPEDPKFAHNFLVLIPSGLKSSIAPSLKTIEQFDPSWILPEPAASDIRRDLHFDVLDEPKSAQKSTHTRNPNVGKVNQYISRPDPMGLVFLVNAEKVILERLELSAQMELIEKTDDEKSRVANELRHLLGKVPRLCIHIDEVHHATDDEIKLRQVVTAWSKSGGVTNVLGYSGTPYLPGADKIAANADVEMQFRQITNTVYYYPLVKAIRGFLKKPAIKTTKGLPPQEIIRNGVREFYEIYGGTRYADGSIAKLAIYCGTIERLEEEIYPFLRDELSVPEGEILKYHKGNAKYKLSQDAALEFAALDSPTSSKRVILLVQVGKEGWDCRSLTGVILAQKGDSPANMVMQTSCRCLRQVEKGKIETALIWLNEENAIVLQKQLQAEQQTGIQEINAIAKASDVNFVPRTSRMDYLQLPPVDFYQLRIDYGTIQLEDAPQPAVRLSDLAGRLDSFRAYAQVQSGTLTGTQATYLTLDETCIVADVAGEQAGFDRWLAQIARESFGGVTYADMTACRAGLRIIFETVTVRSGGGRFYNDLYDQDRLRSAIRACFYSRRKLKTNEEVIRQNAQLLLAANLKPVEPKNLFPAEGDVQAILKGDADGKTGLQLADEYKQGVQSLRAQVAQFADNPLFAHISISETDEVSLAIRSKERTLHYIPYGFAQSKLEQNFMEACLTLDVFKQKGLEIYYNGERGLTEFVIQCYRKKGAFWQHLGEYTPDFLILERDEQRQPRRVLIVETKGKGFEEAFKSRRAFVEADFIRLNADKFGYARFDFIYIREADDPVARNTHLTAKINAFFA